MHELIVLLISVTCCHLAVIPVDAYEYGEEEVSEMKHRQVRFLDKAEQQQVVGSFSTRPTNEFIMPHPKVDYWTFYDTETLSAYETSFNDPFWKFQWYQHDRRISPGPVIDHNIVPVQRMGFNGKGIKIGILGERLGQDLYDMKDTVKELYFAVGNPNRTTLAQLGSSLASFLSLKNVTNVTKPIISNMATKVAGIIAMNANNSQCGAGIAYNAEITGLTVTEKDKSYKLYYVLKGMKYKFDSLDIFVDAIKVVHDGTTMPYSKKLKNVLADIATKGRGEKGGIYVMGSGNGGENEDYCGADYIVNSIYTFVIGSATGNEFHAKYSETCSAIIATAYSSEDLLADECTTSSSIGIVTIDGNQCTNSFGGTAASAAIASGIFALILQANPKLTWRDLMHVIAMSSEQAPLFKNYGWVKNAAGFYVSHRFGFGLLNAENMLLISQKWEPVPKMITCKLTFKDFNSIERGGLSETVFQVNYCPSIDNEDEHLKYIEQVELVTSITVFKRGGISISLISPKGTRSFLLEKRNRDNSTNGYNKWSIRSLHFWGEKPLGIWKIIIHAAAQDWRHTSSLSYIIFRICRSFFKADTHGHVRGDQIHSAELLIHGTSEMPKHYGKPRTYSYAPEYRWSFLN